MGYSRIAKNIAPYGHLEESGHQIINAELVSPGVLGEVKKTITTEDGTELKVGTPIIIQPLNRDEPDATPEFILTPYKKNKKNKRKNQLESGRDTVSEKSHTVKIPTPEHYLNFNNEHFRRSHAVLFPHQDSPSLEDIKQCRIPDCFLLAALQAVINHPNGKSFIRGMMRQNDDGTTTVRFYDEEGQPEYFRVENSVIVDGLGELNRHDALWVHIIEKAFAARAKKNLQTTNASVSSVYSGGGYCRLALQAITGLDVKNTDTKPKAFLWEIEKFLGDNVYNMAKALLDMPGLPSSQIINCLNMLKPVQLAVIYDFFGVTAGDEDAELQALTHYAELVKCHHADPALYDDALKLESAAKLQSHYPEAARILADNFTKRAAFSGHYSQSQLNVYQAMADGLHAGKLITAGTPSKFEQKVVGISDKHAYTVLGVFEKQMQVKDKDGQEKTINARFVQLRNPWGDVHGALGNAREWVTGNGISRAYKQHAKNLDIKIETSNDAIFCIELTEFCQYYSDYDISACANAAFARDAKKEKCIAEVTRFIDEFAIDFTSSNSDLIAANAEYQRQLAQLVNIELLELDKLDAALIQSINAIFAERYDAALERTTVHGLLDETLFPTVSGTAEEVKDHIYHLLKLSWLKLPDNHDKVLEAEEFDAIKQHGTAQPELWENLSVAKIVLNMVTATRMNNYHGTIDYMQELSNKLQHDMEELQKLLDAEKETDTFLIDTLTQSLITNFINLEQFYHQFLSLDIVARDFAYTTNNEQYLSQIAEIIQACETLIKPVIETQTLFRKLWKLRDKILVESANMEQQHEITAAESEEIKSATKRMFSGQLKPLGDKLLASSSENRRELGAKIIEADTLAKKIQRVFNRVGAFFSKTAATISTLFHFKNRYELPALEADAPRMQRPR